MPIALVSLAFFAGSGGIKRSNGQIFETESAYNYIQVLDLNGTHYLRLNEGQGVHSEYNPQTLEYGGPWQQFLFAPFFYVDRQPADITRIAIVGWLPARPPARLPRSSRTSPSMASRSTRKSYRSGGIFRE